MPSARLRHIVAVVGVAGVAATGASGCHTRSHPAPPATAAPTAPAPAPAATAGPDQQAVLQRFTHDIWPAVAAYNASPYQGNPGGVNPAYAQYQTVIDKDIDTDTWGKLRAAVQHLGVIQEGDQTHGPIMRDDELRMAGANITAFNAPNATVQACYTFTARSYQGTQPIETPSAEQATFELHKTDNWYLRAITDDHVVPSCHADNS